MAVLRELLGETFYHPADRVTPLLRRKFGDVSLGFASMDVRSRGNEGEVLTRPPRYGWHVRLVGSADLEVRRKRNERQYYDDSQGRRGASRPSTLRRTRPTLRR